jgi:transcriptional regulator with XRE-family HTH domain
MQINKKIKEARELKQWTQEEIADAIGEKRTTYSGWEKKTIPSFDIVIKISKVTGMPLKEFIAAVDENLANEKIEQDDISSNGKINGRINESGSDNYIEIKTAKGKNLKVKPNTLSDMAVLNAFLEERDQVLEERNKTIEKIEHQTQARIDELIKEKDNLYEILHNYLNDIHTNSKEMAEDIEALTTEIQAEHRAMMDTMDVAAEQPIGTTRAAAGTAEIVSGQEHLNKDKKTGIDKKADMGK